MSAATPRTARPEVSAVVVNHDGGQNVIACVEALYDSKPALASILVVDNASSDGSRERLAKRFPELEILALPRNEGPGPARNAGLERAETPWVLLVDDDVYLAPDCLERLLETALSTGATAVTPRVLLDPDRDVVQCDGAEAHWTGTMTLRHAYRPLDALAPATASVPIGAAISACLLVDRQRTLDAGGFDPLYFLYFEDLEFSLRLRSRGADLYCEPRARVFHDRGLGTPGLSFRSGAYPARRAFLNQRNRWFTLLIHLRGRTLLLLAPALAVYEIASLGFCLLGGHGREWPRAWRSLLGSWPQVRARRARAQRERVRSDAELIQGGPLPMAPGALGTGVAAGLVQILSRALDAYWLLIRRWVART